MAFKQIDLLLNKAWRFNKSLLKKKSVFITIFSIIFYSKTLLYDKATRLTYIIYFATVI